MPGMVRVVKELDTAPTFRKLSFWRLESMALGPWLSLSVRETINKAHMYALCI